MNRQPVYVPKPVADLKEIADDNLATCVKQTLADQEITDAGQLRLLVCTSAGIRDLSGLKQFSNLERLDLSNNRLQRLQVLFEMEDLKELRLRENPALSCADLDTLRNLRGRELSLEAPEHCR